MLGRSGRVAKLADARDLKSRIPRGVCGFDPRLGHTAPPAAATGSILPRTGPRGYFGRMPASPESVSANPRRRSGPPVWLPWVLAPGFLLLPIGGCGVAATLRRPAATAATVEPVTTVATVMPPHRSVAWHPGAN